MYGTPDAAHFPSSGAIYELTVEKPASASWPWLPRWDEDEGAGAAVTRAPFDPTPLSRFSRLSRRSAVVVVTGWGWMGRYHVRYLQDHGETKPDRAGGQVADRLAQAFAAVDRPTKSTARTNSMKCTPYTPEIQTEV